MTLEYDHKCRLYHAEEAGHEKGHEEGLQEGMKAGQDRLASLMKILMSEDRIEELGRALDSPGYCEELYRQYGL